MREFLHGWRRKAGIGLLVISLAVTTAWIGSRGRAISMRIPLNLKNSVYIRVLNGGIGWSLDESTSDIVLLNYSLKCRTVAVPVTILSAYLLLWPGKQSRSSRNCHGS